MDGSAERESASGLILGPQRPGLLIPGTSIPQVKTPEQAIQVSEKFYFDAARARAACNIIVPAGRSDSVLKQRKAYNAFMLRYGAALGIFSGFLMTGLMTAEAYNAFLMKTKTLMLPTVTGGF